MVNLSKVVNLRKEPYDIYIGRPSKWGNPFVIGKDGSREDVIRKYESYLRENEYLLSHLYELKDKTLGCFCKPLACHGDILVKFLERGTKEYWQEIVGEDGIVDSVYSKFGIERCGEDLLITFPKAYLDVTWSRDECSYHVTLFSLDWEKVIYGTSSCVENVDEEVRNMISFYRENLKNKAEV